MLTASIGATAALAAAEEPPKRAFFELRCYYMRNSKSNQVQRTTEFVWRGYLAGGAACQHRTGRYIQRCYCAGIAVSDCGVGSPVSGSDGGVNG